MLYAFFSALNLMHAKDHQQEILEKQDSGRIFSIFFVSFLYKTEMNISAKGN